MVALRNVIERRPVAAVLLAGSIRPSPLCSALDVHVLCLPVGPRGCLLDAWLEALAAVPQIGEILVVVNTQEEVEAVNAAAGIANGRLARGFAVRTIAEPSAWRGVGGILRDVSADLPEHAVVLACEVKRLPPQSIEPLVQTFDERDVAGVVGVCGTDEPAGVYAFTRSAIELIPRIGYFDMKEQFLPALGRSGERVTTVTLGPRAWRMSDLETYLATVHRSLDNGDLRQSLRRVSDDALVSPTAVIDGFCIIEPRAVIEDGAVLHDSVVLAGARVGGGAVVSQSVIGPSAEVEPRSRVVRECVTKPVKRGRAMLSRWQTSAWEKSAW